MTNIASEFANYAYWDVQVPGISSPADIQDALRIYHHGTTDTDPDTTQDYFKNSIAGILTDLEDSKRDLTLPSIPGEISLNTYQTSGVYIQDSDSSASTTYNYPTNSRGGLLRVEEENGVVFQSYHDSLNYSYVRSYWAGVWSTWNQQMDDRHNHDSLYYRKDTVDAKPTVYLGKDGSGAQLVSATRKIIVAAPQTDGNGVQTPNITINTPLVPGDLWFW